MTTLFHHLKSTLGGKAAKAVRSFLDAAALPLPQENEFFISKDSGLMVFLQAEACIMRFLSPFLPSCPDGMKSVRPVVDPDVLQPFGAKDIAANLSVEIVPGVKCGTAETEYKNIITRLAQKGLQVADVDACYYRNSGRLPDGTPVIIDRGAIVNPRHAAAMPMELGAQEKFFGGLRAAFNEGWQYKAVLPKQEKMIDLWEKCRQMKQTGLLVTGWDAVTKDDCYNIGKVKQSAQQYQHRRTDGPALLLN